MRKAEALFYVRKLPMCFSFFEKYVVFSTISHSGVQPTYLAPSFERVTDKNVLVHCLILLKMYVECFSYLTFF